MTFTFHDARSTLLALLAMAGAPAMAVDVGATAPEFSLPGSRAPVKLSDFKGKMVYLDFWASWCGPCKQSFPWMNQIQAKYGAQGLQVLAINVDANRADADRFLAGTPAEFLIAFDAQGASARQYGIKGMPSSVLIGPDGKVLMVHAGFNPTSRAQLNLALANALEKRP